MAHQIYAEVQKLDLEGLVDLYKLDCTDFGGEIMRFHGYEQLGPIYWQGEVYEPWPIQVEGIEVVGEGPPPQPTLQVGNIGKDADGNPLPGVISALCIQFQDLVGARLELIRTFGKFLDAANFPDGNPNADPDEYMREVLVIEAKTSETRAVIVFELAQLIDADGIQIPDFTIQAGVCPWTRKGGYRGPYCQYTGAAMFTEDDQPTTDPEQDRCGGRLSSCKVRQAGFPEQVLNFCGFPAADRIRS